MSEYAKQIQAKETELKTKIETTLNKQQAQNKLDLKLPDFDKAFTSRQVRDQERFRRLYKLEHKKDGDNIQINPPKEYAPEDVESCEKKYGYFAKKSRIRTAKESKALWKEALSKRQVNSDEETGYRFDVTEKTSETTQDYMLSIRRFIEVENAKRQIADEILTPEKLQVYNEAENAPIGKVLEEFRTTLINLGPSLEVIPAKNEAMNSEVRFTDKSVAEFKAYLNALVENPMETIGSAITDTVHTVINFPDKMLGENSIPSSFDRLMQIRNRYRAINDLRKYRMLPENVDEKKNPLGALMTKLYPREEKGKEPGLKKPKQKVQAGDEDHLDDHHDEKANFRFIKWMEKAINSDLISTMNKAGITFRDKLFDSEEKDRHVKANGNVSRDAMIQLKKNLDGRTQKEKDEAGHLNAHYWEGRLQAEFSKVEHNLAIDQNDYTDFYGLSKAARKIEAGVGKKVEYNKALGTRLQNDIDSLSVSIDELRKRIEVRQRTLELPSVICSRELSGRTKARIEREKYELFMLLDRANGYINAYEHVLTGKELSARGTSVMDEMKLEDAEGVDGWSLYSDKLNDGIYSTDTIDRMNRVIDTKLRPEAPDLKSDRDAVRQLSEFIVDLEKTAGDLFNDIKTITAKNKNSVLDRLITFKHGFDVKSAMFSHKLSDGTRAEDALFSALEKQNKEELAKVKDTLALSMSRAHFINVFTEFYRMENILYQLNNGELRESVKLTSEEEGYNAEQFALKHKELTLLRKVYLEEISSKEKAMGMNALEEDMVDRVLVDEQDVEEGIKGILERLDMEQFSDKQVVKKAEEEKKAVEDKKAEEEKKVEEEKKAEDDQEQEKEEKQEKIEDNKPEVEQNKEEEKNEDNPGAGRNQEEQNKEEKLNENNEKDTEKEENKENQQDDQAVLNKEGEQKNEEKPKDEDEPKVEEEQPKEEVHKNEKENQEEKLNKEKEPEQEEQKKDNNGQPNEQPYVKRITSKISLDMINNGELKTVRQWANYIAGQLKVLNGVNIVSWDEIVKETKAWLVGRKVTVSELKQEGEVDKIEDVEKEVTAENFDEFINRELKQSMLEEDKSIVDPSQFDPLYEAANESDDHLLKYPEGSVANLFKNALFLDSMKACSDFTKQKLPAKSVAKDIQQTFLKHYDSMFMNNIAYKKEGKNTVEVKDIKIPEKDYAHINWILGSLPENIITLEGLSEFRKRWQEKLGYDYLKKQSISPITYKKIRCLFDTFEKAIDDVIETPKIQKQRQNLDKTNVKKKVKDFAVPDADKQIPNQKQWYGASCWATSGTLISKWYLQNVLHDQNPDKIDQMSFLDPDQIQFNPYAENLLEIEKRTENKDGGLSGEERNIRDFMKPHGSYGSLISTADVFLSQMSNTAVRHIRFNVPIGDSNFDVANMKKADRIKVVKQFYDRVSELMRAGSGPISLLIPGHYRTITGFKDGKLQFRDSMKPDYKEKPDEFTIEEFEQEWSNTFRNGIGCSLELVFLQNINNENKEALENKYNFNYDENGKLVYNEKDEEKEANSPEKMLHKLGRLYASNQKDPDSFLDRFIVDELYVPKNLDHNKNVQEVNKWIEDTRKNLGLKQLSDQEIQAKQKAKADFEKEAEAKRKEYAERIKQYKQPEKTIEQILEGFEQFDIEKCKDLIKEYDKDNDKYSVKFFFGEKNYSDGDKKVLETKVRSYYNRLKSGGETKNTKPSVMDMFHVDYSDKDVALDTIGVISREKDLKAHDNAGGTMWLLTAEDTKTIKTMLESKNEQFTSKLSESNESTLRDRNEALAKIKDGDVSMYNHLPLFLKEYYGRIRLEQFLKEIKESADGSIPDFKDLSAESKAKLAKMTRDPVFRGVINLLIRRKATVDGPDNKKKEIWKELKKYDVYMNQMLILQTLAPMELTEYDNVVNHQKNSDRKVSQKIASDKYGYNMTKQRHLAKMMFMLQLGRFDQIDTKPDLKKTTSQFNEPISEALSHGARVCINLPAGNKLDQEELKQAWKGEAGDLMTSRFATHEFHRKKKNVKGSKFTEVRLKGGKASTFGYLFKRKKDEKPASYFDNYGMNLALGGMGKSFNGNRSMIDDQGAFGHLYQRYRTGDANTCAGMLLGIENSGPKVLINTKDQYGGYSGVSSVGEVHSSKALSHGASAFYSGKEIPGDVIGGRIVDLSNVSAHDLAVVIQAFDTEYKQLQMKAGNLIIHKEPMPEDKKKLSEDPREQLRLLNTMLSGMVLSAKTMYELLTKVLRVNKAVARRVVEAGRSKEGAEHTSNEKAYPKRLYEIGKDDDNVQQEIDQLLKENNPEVNEEEQANK